MLDAETAAASTCERTNQIPAQYDVFTIEGVLKMEGETQYSYCQAQ